MYGTAVKTFHFLVLGDFCVIFLLAGHGQMIVSRCCHYSSSRVLPSQGIGRSGHYNQSENSFFSSAFSLNVRNFPDVIPCCLEKRKCCSSNNIPNQKKIWQNVRWYRIWVLRCGRPGFRWKNRVGRNMGTLFSPLSLLWYSVQLIFNP